MLFGFLNRNKRDIKRRKKTIFLAGNFNKAAWGLDLILIDYLNDEEIVYITIYVYPITEYVIHKKYNAVL